MRPNFKIYYFAALMTGLIAGIVTEDKYIGILLVIALMLAVEVMKQRYRQGNQ